jgi:RimJ/RimL family protein N-acetyltransferase
VPDAPIIETERLILRGWREEDYQPFAAMMADPETARFIGGVQSANDAWRTMATIIGHWQLRGYGFWVVERKSDKTFLGRIGLWQPEGWPGMEVGWGLARGHWGNGYATEAAKASLDYGFHNYKVAKLISTIHPENIPSQRVAKRLGEIKGAPFEHVIYGNRSPVDIWEISREKWEAGQKS